MDEAQKETSPVMVDPHAPLAATPEPLIQTALWKRPAILRLLLVALLAEIGYAVLNISTMPVYLKFDRGFDANLIGLVVVAFLLSEAILKGPMGHLADRVGRRRLMVIGPSLTIFTSLATMIVPHQIGAAETLCFIGLRLLDGLGAAMLWPATFALMSDLVNDKERQEAMSLLNMCYLLGVALALPVGGIFNDLFGGLLRKISGERTPSLYFAAMLFTAVSLVAYWYVPSGKAMRERNSAGAKTEAEQVQGEGFRVFIDAIHRIPQFLALGALTFAGIGFPMVIIKLFAEEQFHMSETQFGVLALPGALAMAGLSVPMSKFGERIGRPKAVHLGLGLCFIGMAIIALGAFSPFARNAWFLAIGGMPVGVGFLLTIPAWYASVSEIDPDRRAANIGAVMTAQGLGAIVGAPLGGWAYSGLQSVQGDFGRYSPFLGCAICIGIAFAVSLRLIK